MEGETGETRPTPFEAVESEARKVLPPPPGHPRFPSLDSLRAFGALSILTVHVIIVSGGFNHQLLKIFSHFDIGVPVFFVLSGFLLYRPMLGARILKLPSQRTVNYARNRFFRIVPLFWTVLTLSAIAPGLFGAFSDKWWVYYGLAQNFPVYTPAAECLAVASRCGIANVWSLSIEVMFYISLPFYSLALAWLHRRLIRFRWFVPELAVLLILSILSFQVQKSLPDGGLHQWLFFSPLGRAWWFAGGMGLAVLSVYCQGRETPVRAVAWLTGKSVWLYGLALALYLFLTYVVLEPNQFLVLPYTTTLAYLSGYLIAGLVAVLVVFPAIFVAKPRDLIQVVLRSPFLSWLGLISYGIFLWQFPVIYVLVDLGARDLNRILFAALVLIGTIAVSAVSFYAIERPAMLFSRRRGRATSK